MKKTAIRGELTLKVLPPTLNEIIDTARRNRFGSAAQKKTWTNRIASACGSLPKFSGKVWVEYVWRVKNLARDEDNVSAARKYIHDGLVQAGIISDDNLRVIQSPTVHWFEKSDHDGFSLFIYNDVAWKTRCGERNTCDEAPSPKG